MSADSLLLHALREPRSLVRLDLAGWDLLIRQARRAELLGRLGALSQDHGLLEALPVQPRRHLQWARATAEAHARSVRWEVQRVREALAEVADPVVLLKGAAYGVAGLPPARGRLFQDIDILVPASQLPEVESSLMLHGWNTTHRDAYDQRYYRRWMHELPPMRHMTRGTTLDVHHAILPRTARLRPDSQLLMEAAIPIPERPPLAVLAPTDMILHSATHLFHDEALERGLRDLVDLDDLLRHWGSEPGFWSRLLERAEALGLERPLYYALRHTARHLATPVPSEALRHAGSGRPPRPWLPVMDALFDHGLTPDHRSCRRQGAGLARWLLYVRSHYLRMPLYRLLPHLARKSLRREQEA